MGFISNKHLYKGIVTTKHLDDLMSAILSANNPVAWAVAAIKMACFIGYVSTRKVLVDQQLDVEKQEYEQKQTNSNGQGMDDNPIIKPKPTSDLDG